MKIQPVQNNNTNFQGLHMDKRASKYFKNYNLLANPSIKECADKFEVVIKGEKVKSDKKLELSDLALNTGFSIFFGMMCGIIGTAGAMVTNLPFINASSRMLTSAPLLGGTLGLLGGTSFIIINMLKPFFNINYSLQVGKNVKKSSFGKVELENPISSKYQIRTNSLANITNLAQIVQQNDQRQFVNIIRKYDKNNIFEPTQLLKILNDDEIKQNYKNGESFNYKLENNSNDTMLTKFLDIVPTEENKKDYQEIIKFMKNAKNIDYKQVDSNGISAIEKIINSENPDLLDLVKDIEFDYSRELDYAYERIDDKNFKDKVKNLNINFPNVKEAIRLNSTEALQELLPEFKSPFFNTKKLVSDLSGKVSINNLNNAITFLEDNGIDTAGVIL